MIKGIIFDVGGILEKDTDSLTYQKMSKLFNRDYTSVEEAVDEALPDFQVGKIDNREFCNRVANKLKVDIPIEKWKNLWADEYIKNVQSHKEVDSLVRKLEDAGYKLGILSNTEPPHAGFNRRKNRFTHFDVVILSCEVGLRKPDPRIYKLVLEKLGVEAHECVFIDDKEKYLVPARELGMHAILYQNPSQLEKDLKKLGIRFYLGITNV